jgi:hypothetical protein
MNPNDPQKLLGSILSEDESRRDAVHVAIMPVTTGEDFMFAGQWVNFVYGSKDVVKGKPESQAIGIIDPFLVENARKGARVWLFLRPNTVSGMRHHWSHPDVDADAAQAHIGDSEKWLRAFADKWNFNFTEMIEAARDGGIIVANGVDLHSAKELEGDDVLFWKHVEEYTGTRFGKKHRAKVGWSCSC